MTLAILLRDNHLLALNKPAGMPTVPDASGDRSLLEAAKEWIQREHGKPGRVFLGVVHRLDRPVSGVVLFARTSKAAARLAAAWRTQRVRKQYWGVTAGAPAAESGELEQWLRKDPERNRVAAVAPGAGLRARTRWRVLQRRGGRTWLALEPLSGRPHQLRAACAALGCPLLGDLKYGAPAPLPDASIALHARALEFPHPIGGALVQVTAPLPPGAWWN